MREKHKPGPWLLESSGFSLLGGENSLKRWGSSNQTSVAEINELEEWKQKIFRYLYHLVVEEATN